MMVWQTGYNRCSCCSHLRKVSTVCSAHHWFNNLSLACSGSHYSELSEDTGKDMAFPLRGERWKSPWRPTDGSWWSCVTRDWRWLFILFGQAWETMRDRQFLKRTPLSCLSAARQMGLTATEKTSLASWKRHSHELVTSSTISHLTPSFMNDDE